ncbi:acylphosphatase [Sphingomonas jatrophae]|uniref:Acylphosphatase n=1 Tax=Sphingomonas jatrophae TaxID=1166337 RepID=A0A1I6LKZ0_9SPHN|nr:acylphosphatase [Sphingomonas jatrophae]SFS04154.1 acylphosphatase [Sphingomonas jatrophae]
MIHVRLRVTGRVQGVFFRDWTVSTAQALGLSGWVRNRHDGSVEAHAAGTQTAIDAFVSACRTGPSAARVDDVIVTPAEPMPLDGFRRSPAN